MTLHAASNCKPAFEIHLPKLIWSCMLEPLPGGVFRRFLRINSIVTKDLVNRTVHGNPDLTQYFQSNADFAGPPCRMIVTHLQDLRLHVGLASLRRAVWTTRTILQTFFPSIGVATKPLINCFWTHIETMANLPNVGIRSFR